MKTYRQNLLQKISGSSKVVEYEKVIQPDYEGLIDEFFPDRVLENGWARVNSEGDAGRSRAFNVETGKWTNFAEQLGGSGFLSFLIELKGWSGLGDFCRTHKSPLNFLLLDKLRVPDFSPAVRYAEGRGFELGGRWEYRDTDGFLLGIRVRFNDRKTGGKEFKLLSYRTNCEVKEKHRREGWRLDGDWGPLDPLYGLEKFGEIGNRTILICEGEKATDAANKLIPEEVFATTWGWGSASGTAKADWSFLPDSNRKVTWPDKDEPGRKVVEKLAGKIAGLKVVQVWDCPELKEGDDLYDVPQNFRDTVLKMIADATTLSGTKVGNELKTRFIYIEKTGEFFDRTDGTILDTNLFRKKHMVQVECLDEELLQDPAMIRVNQTSYMPGKSDIYEDAMDGYNRRFLNSYRAHNLEAAEGDPEYFLEHMSYLVPNEKVRNHIIDYLAFMIQHPGVKMHWAPLIQGVPGTGKSYLAFLMCKILGRHNVKEITTDEFKGDFSGWVEGGQLVVFEEVMTNGRRDLMNKIKTQFTSETVRVNKKNVQDYHVPNVFNFLLFTNYEDAVLLDDGDRRFMIYNSPARPQSEEYYTNLFTSTIEEAGQVLWMLQNRDLTKFNPKGVAPMTEDKKRLMESSKGELYHVIKEAIDTAVLPFNLDMAKQSEIMNYARAHANLRNPKQLTPVLKQLGCREIARLRDGNGHVTVWAVRNADQYVDFDAQACRDFIARPTS